MGLLSIVSPRQSGLRFQTFSDWKVNLLRNIGNRDDMNNLSIKNDRSWSKLATRPQVSAEIEHRKSDVKCTVLSANCNKCEMRNAKSNIQNAKKERQKWGIQNLKLGKRRMC